MPELDSLLDQALQADYGFPATTSAGVRCGNHYHRVVHHDSADAVRACYAASYDLEAQQKAEAYAEDAWLRAAEAGTPDTWADEDRDRLTEIYGYGPPPGYSF